jgi:predicted dehydrogenase
LRVSDPFLYSYDRYRDYLKGTWKEVAGPGSGQFYSLGPHLIDQALHCFGRPERVTAFIENIRGMGDEAVDDDVTIISFDLDAIY